MDKNKLLHIIKQGENETLEFKLTFSKLVIETIVAFSNTKGGRIILGVNDKQNIIGIAINKESIQNWINEIKQNTEPSLFPDFDKYYIDNKLIITITVNEFPLKPISFRNKYYSRKKNANHKLTVDEIVEMRYNSLSYSFDAYNIETKYSELDKTALETFKTKIKKSGRFKATDNLKNDLTKLGFINNGKLTRATELLFGTHHTNIHIGRFKNKHTIIDDVIIRSPLILAVDESLDFIKRNIRLGYQFGDSIERIEKWEYPILALRELLLNAIVHRDYTNPTDIIIKIFDDSIEFINPGSFLLGITPKDILTDNYIPKHRNKLLTEAFYLTGAIEKYGTGYVRLRNWLKEYPNLNISVDDKSKSTRVVVVHTKKQNSAVDNVVDNGVDNVVDRIVQLIKNNAKITTKQISISLNINERTVQRKIKILKETNIIKRIGSARSGYWELL